MAAAAAAAPAANEGSESMYSCAGACAACCLPHAPRQPLLLGAPGDRHEQAGGRIAHYIRQARACNGSKRLDLLLKRCPDLLSAGVQLDALCSVPSPIAVYALDGQPVPASR
jgi:hypothetical protein